VSDAVAGGRRRRVAVTAAALVVLAGGGAVFVEKDRLWPGTANSAAGGVADNPSPTSLATVARRDLTAQQQVNGTLGYTGSYAVVNNARGTLTALPAVGQVISQGQPIYRVSGDPVILLYGSTPVYRDLAQTDTGPDVVQLNAALVALGYSSTVDPKSDYFGSRTASAVKRLQKAMGVTEDGILHVGQAVFLPGAIRITQVPAILGAPAGGTIAQASSTGRQVVVALDASQQAQVKVGDKVTITLPDKKTTPATVTAVGAVASTPQAGSNNPPTVEVDITPADPAATGSLDQAPVRVSIVTASVPNALVVPVNALLSLAGGGYGVEVAETDGTHRLVAVTPGLFDDADGLVEVTDTALRPGDRVVVAGS
jgi:peptidoglycan hydrolase-like protein with peptidoglycan-binding domain